MYPKPTCKKLLFKVEIFEIFDIPILNLASIKNRSLALYSNPKSGAKLKLFVLPLISVLISEDEDSEYLLLADIIKPTFKPPNAENFSVK